MATITRYDNSANPGVKLLFDDVGLTFSMTSTDDGGAAKATANWTDSLAQRAVELSKGDKGGIIELNTAGGLIMSIAPDNSVLFTVQKDGSTPQQVALTAAQGQAWVGWLQTLAGVT